MATHALISHPVIFLCTLSFFRTRAGKWNRSNSCDGSFDAWKFAYLVFQMASNLPSFFPFSISFSRFSSLSGLFSLSLFSTSRFSLTHAQRGFLGIFWVSFGYLSGVFPVFSFRQGGIRTCSALFLFEKNCWE